MPRAKTQPVTFTVGQLAKRWNVDAGRIWALIREGKLPGAFRIPSAGQYGETVKIPIDAVKQAEAEWAMTEPPKGRKRPRPKDDSDILEQLPGLAGHL